MSFLRTEFNVSTKRGRYHVKLGMWASFMYVCITGTPRCASQPLSDLREEFGTVVCIWNESMLDGTAALLYISKQVLRGIIDTDILGIHILMWHRIRVDYFFVPNHFLSPTFSPTQFYTCKHSKLSLWCVYDLVHPHHHSIQDSDANPVPYPYPIPDPVPSHISHLKHAKPGKNQFAASSLSLSIQPQHEPGQGKGTSICSR